jgi:hypothetical protein
MLAAKEDRQMAHDHDDDFDQGKVMIVALVIFAGVATLGLSGLILQLV